MPRIFNEARAIRVGEPGSPVHAGDVKPDGTSRYENGQFAPSVDVLATFKLSEANKAGLLSTDLPFVQNGQIDDDGLKNWNFAQSFKEILPRTAVAPHLPSYSAASIFTTLKFVNPRLLEQLGLYSIRPPTPEELQFVGQSEIVVGSTTSSVGRTFGSSIIIYPKFYEVISLPIVRAIPGRSTGLSLASYAIFHEMGKIYYKYLNYAGKLDQLGKFLALSGWNKTSGHSGHFLDNKNQSVWKKKNEDQITQLACFSPADDFAESFAQYHTHRNYMETEFPEQFTLMTELIG